MTTVSCECGQLYTDSNPLPPSMCGACGNENIVLIVNGDGWTDETAYLYDLYVGELA